MPDGGGSQVNPESEIAETVYNSDLWGTCMYSHVALRMCSGCMLEVELMTRYVVGGGVSS